MKDYDYADIEVLIDEARRMRSEVLGEYLSRAWHAVVHAVSGFAGKSGDHGRHGPCLPA